MQRRCEICSSTTAPHGARPPAKLRRLLLEDRIVALCERHAQRAHAAGVESLDQLRSLFHEPEHQGRRTLLPRRSPLDRRVFPARPEGRRAADGRRATDGEADG
jgi:hypothetical protein